LDVAAIVMDGAEEHTDVPRIPLPTGDAAEKVDDEVRIDGHSIDGAAGSGDELVVPRSVFGRIALLESDARGFIDTGGVDTVMGMCGGPVINSSGVCVGLLEGLVPRLSEGGTALSSYHATVAGKSVYVRASELVLFLSEVEAEWERARKARRRDDIRQR
jgi:hypothetical protein